MLPGHPGGRISNYPMKYFEKLATIKKQGGT